MKNALFLFAIFIAGIVKSQNPLVCVNHELYTNSETVSDFWGYGDPTGYPEGHNTFRVYAYLDDYNSVLQSVIGVPEGLESYIGSDTPNGQIWNFQFGDILSMNMNPDFFDFYGLGATPMFDSYVTIGIENQGLPFNASPVTFGTGESNISAEVFWGNSTYSDVNNPDFIMTNEAWVCNDVTGYNCYGVGPDYRVLIAQITTEAEDIHYGLNVTALTNVPLNGGQVWINYWDESGLGGTFFNEAYDACKGLKYPSDVVFGCMDSLGCNYNPLAVCDKETCTYPGCTDNTACNYDDQAACDDGSCLYGYFGCTEPEATNFDPEATCLDQSCTFDIVGRVYFDANQDGWYNNDDYFLVGHEVNCVDPNLTTFTNSEGFYEFSDIPVGTRIFGAELNENYPSATTPNPETLILNSDFAGDTLETGLYNEIQLFDLEILGSGNQILCNDVKIYAFAVRNLGNVTINGTTSLILDENIESYIEYTSIDSIVGEEFFFSYENLYPGHYQIFGVTIETPSEVFIGEELEFLITATSFDQFGTELDNENFISIQTVVCSYDPNDKQVSPGYAEPKFVKNDETLEYLIRFQNTGNAPAATVKVLDTIGINLNLESFNFLSSSHNVVTTINQDTREIEFNYEGIMLPDSISNEPESHGYIQFTLDLVPGLPEGIEILNTGHIYFDNNPAVVTNTTLNTIYYCSDDLATLETTQLELCVGEPLVITNTQSYIENYQWKLDETVLDLDSNSIELSFLEAGLHQINLLASNPLCIANDSITVEVFEAPIAQILGEILLCNGESSTLIASGGDSYVWSTQETNEEITVTPSENTDFEVLVTNENNCSATALISIEVNENPVATISGDELICQGETTVLFSVGGDFYEWNTEETTSNIEVGPLETTTYSVTVTDENNCSDTTEVIVVVAESPEIEISETSEICQGEEVELSVSGAETYDWSTEETTSEILVSPEETTSYEVTGFNVEGCSDLEEVTVVVNPTPILELTEDSEICLGEVIELSVSGGDEYSWSTEESAEEISVSPEETTIYEVTGFTNEGCSDTAEVTVQVNPNPTADITDNAEICLGDEVELSATGGETYVWSTEETTPDILVSPEETTEYLVEVFNEFDCSDEATVLVTVVPLPEANFTDLGALLTAMEADSYQWYLNGELIDGAAQQTYTAEENGNYSVEVWNENDCSAISDEISVTIISVEEILLSDFNLYPNPISNSSTLEFKNEGNFKVQMYDLTGKLVRDYGIINSSSLEIQKENLAFGNYQIWIQEGNQVWKISAQIR